MTFGVATASGLLWAMQTHVFAKLILLVSPRLEEEEKRTQSRGGVEEKDAAKALRSVFWCGVGTRHHRLRTGKTGPV